MVYRFLSFGAGVQTTALLLMDEYDEVIFADTKGEWPETYAYLEKYTLPYVKEKGIKFTVLDQVVEDEKRGIVTRSLEEWCLQHRMAPSRLDRWCTDRFKIRRIRKYVKDRGQVPAISVMGISVDEIKRMHKPHWSEYRFEYPLIDKGLTREDCKQIILKNGFPLPPKSGCFYCPFQKRSQFAKLYFEHPELYEKARMMEERQHGFLKHKLIGTKSLGQLAEALGEGSSKLTEFIDEDPEECESGFCMV